MRKISYIVKRGNLKKNIVRIALCLGLGSAVSFAASTGVWAADDDYYDVFYKRIFANGHALIIEEGTSGNTRVKCDKNDNGTYETDETIYEGDMSKCEIFGGKRNGDVINTNITMNGGNVDSIFAGGYASSAYVTNPIGRAYVTGEAKITVNGGSVRYISGGSYASYGKAEVNKAEIVVNGGIVEYIYANYLGGHGEYHSDEVSYEGDTNNVKDVSFSIMGGYVKYVKATGSSALATYDNISSFIISGASVDSLASEIPSPKSPDGKELCKIIMDHECDGELYKNKKINYVVLGDNSKYYLNNVYTTAYRASIYIWLPEDTTVKYSADSKHRFVSTALDKTFRAEFMHYGTDEFTESEVVSNIVVKPKISQQITYQFGKTDFGFTSLYTSLHCPYTIKGDAPRQKNAGEYTTTFSLPKGLKWSDDSTGDYVVEWKINKDTHAMNPNNYHAYDESTYKGKNGRITGLHQHSNYEISTDNSNWTDVAEGSAQITNLAPGTYYLRIKEDINYFASEALTFTINAAPKPTKELTIKEYGSNEVLCKVTAEMLDTKKFKAYIPKDYFDYAFFEYGYSNSDSNQIIPEYDKKSGMDTMIIQDHTTIFALKPTYLDKNVSYDLTDDKEVAVVMDEKSGDFLGNLDDNSYDNYYITNYFDKLLRYKLQNNEFGDVSGFDEYDMDSLYCSKTYYVIPCKADDSRLTKSDRHIVDSEYKNATIIPHISLSNEEGAVMKINVDKVTEYGHHRYTFTFSSIEDTSISDGVILDLGRYPKGHGDFIVFKYTVYNTVINSTKFSISYGQKTVPTPAPTATTEPTATPDLGATTEPTQLPSGNPDITPTAAPSSDPGVTPTSVPTSDPSAQPVSTNEPQVSDVPVKTVEKVILDSNTDKADVAGSTQRFLFLRTAAVKKNSIKIKWNKVSGADGYMIYGSKCGSKMKFIKDIKKPNATSCTFKKLKKNTYYKYMVVAYKNTDSEPMVITTSKSVHAATSGGKKGNPIAIKKVKKKYTIKKGKTLKLKPAFTSKKKVSLHIAKFRYESLDESVATVSKKGKIKAVGKGETTILVYTQNGICKKVKLVVK